MLISTTPYPSIIKHNQECFREVLCLLKGYYTTQFVGTNLVIRAYVLASREANTAACVCAFPTQYHAHPYGWTLQIGQCNNPLTADILSTENTLMAALVNNSAMLYFDSSLKTLKTLTISKCFRNVAKSMEIEG